ncbi:cytosolic poly glycohydrolase [Polychytrium aggregatum]|uniref:cytosolic poly glycohydrolase n=1 Tax=Polychytrium aggregatum TaxID=110093 RepID=UPI0022FF3088|nr:cytosolic poly glycohydrolase [Polychytrium aggregatum]KAI9193663.1 cytosolic poly glycohydrolase [Polychytrium aggregatum]
MVLDMIIPEIWTYVEAILSYNPVHRRKWDFSGLMHYFSCRAKESRELFKSVIPFMTRLALELPKVLEQPIPLLKIGENKAITLSQRQIASLLANAFFCTFPRRNDHRKSSEYGTFPSIHFNLLFAGVPSSGECFPAQAAKLDGLFHYFRTIMRKDPQGTVTFQRRAVPPDCLPVWNECPELLSEMTVDAAGSIEDDGRDMLQLDFANKMIGGGVVGRGAVQEEIRFILSPELIVSRLFVEELQDYECVLIVGAQRYSRHQGYSSTFEWYQRKSVIRELNKAYGGFLPSPVSSHDVATPIATGNWGCGAFNGDPQLKSLLQLMAASVAKRQLFYFTFGDYELCSQLRAIHTGLKEQMVTVGQLYDWIRAYFTNIVRANIESNSKISTTLYDYIWSQLE